MFKSNICNIEHLDDNDSDRYKSGDAPNALRLYSSVKPLLLVGLILGIVIIAGCNQIGEIPSTTNPTETHMPIIASEGGDNGLVPVTTPSPGQNQSVTYDSALQPIVKAAIGDLADRLEIPTGEIDVVEASAVVWPDGSAGCPSPNLNYIQVQEEGTLVRLAYKHQIFDYHQSESRSLFLCETSIGESNK